MSRHLLNIWFDTESTCYTFCGYVTTRVFSPSKLFKKLFGFDMPIHTQITLI